MLQQFSALCLNDVRFLAATTAARSANVKASKLPSRGMTVPPYSLFIQEQYSKTSGKDAQEQLKDLAQKWKNLSNDEKKKYTEKSHAIREERISAFTKLPEDEQKKLVEQSGVAREEMQKRRLRKEKRQGRLDSGKPKVPPNSYAIFIKQEFEALKKSGKPITTVTPILKAFAAKWNSLNADDRKKFDESAATLRTDYQKKLLEWKASVPKSA